ncbi:multi-sensor signal transduction histidine kinase [Methanosalsum zhilinae DSM 4017]|uniref:histidine kinase n=1 Tax=Methanosalsum zhilinae (strain DSM 4017 / NBRC 107636 / OCM 62 / WeN5) TaxID=679901 RepID=F7XMM1_METZD|nr:GAF domain-containing protein [Methanosalsum zhilinae]AEH61036.1 multi-sensor signal transduction histidine kinase [Methanosalsum zhilinae DSM 4017]
MSIRNEYSLIFRNSPHGIFHFNTNDVITDCNEKMANILRLPTEKIIGYRLDEVFENDLIFSSLKDVFFKKRTHYEGDLELKDGKKSIKIKIDCSQNISDDGSIVGGICIAEDITRHKKLEDALKLDESRLESLLKLNMISDKATMQEITDFVHEAAVNLTGSKIGYVAFLNEDETVFTMHTWSNSVMKECSVPNKKFVYPIETTGLWGEPVRQRKPIIINDYQSFNSLKKGYPPGHVELERYMSVPVFDDDRIVATAGVGNKDEDYDRADVRQLRLLMQGMWKIIQRKKSLEKLRSYAEELERSNELKELFLDILRHDLLNPAGVVKGYIDLLIGQEKDHSKIQVLKTIERNNNKVIKMIEDASRFAKLDSIEDIEFETFDIGLMLKNVVDSFSPQIDEKEMDVDFQSEGVYLAQANPIIEEVFVNIFSNAIKYSPEKSRIIIDILDAGKYWKIMVTDFGEGIDEKSKPFIFERFKRMNKPGIKGTGLGLTIVKKIIDLHGTQVGVEDNPQGKGSVFWFTVNKA